METVAALVRVFGYLYIAIMMTQTAVVAKRLRGALLSTAALLASQGANALLLAIGEREWRDVLLMFVSTPLIVVAAWMWMRAFWHIGTNGTGRGKINN